MQSAPPKNAVDDREVPIHRKADSSSFDPSLHLVENESLEAESRIHPLSQFRSYVIGFLTILAGFFLAASNLELLLGTLLLIFVIYVASLQSIGSLIKTALEAFVGIYGFLIMFNALNNLNGTLSALGNLVGANPSNTPTFSGSGFSSLLSPTAAVGQIESWFASGIAYLGPNAPVISGLVVASGFAIIILSYMYARGQRVFFTDRRVIITKRFGGSSMFQAPIDSISDISSNSGIGGRLFGYGALYFTTTAGSGVYERDQEGRPRPGRALSRVKLTADGVKDADQLAITLMKLKMEFIDSLHLKEMKGYMKKIMESLRTREEDPVSSNNELPPESYAPLVHKKNKKNNSQEQQSSVELTQ